MIENQIQAVTRPLQRRFSSQPMGLCSSERRIHWRNVPCQKTGVQKNDSTSACSLVFSLSCQLRRICQAERIITPGNKAKHTAASANTLTTTMFCCGSEIVLEPNSSFQTPSV